VADLWSAILRLDSDLATSLGAPFSFMRRRALSLIQLFAPRHRWRRKAM
jgi:hypothetical protein